MTREIKFRAWDGNHMIIPDGIIQPYTGICYCIMVDGFDKIVEEEKSPIMQFTGLYDKNNQPIYEGDVLKFHNGFCEDNADAVWYNTGGRGLEDREIFLHELFIWINESNKDLGRYLDVEVIGNIYDGI